MVVSKHRWVKQGDKWIQPMKQGSGYVRYDPKTGKYVHYDVPGERYLVNVPGGVEARYRKPSYTPKQFSEIVGRDMAADATRQISISRSRLREGALKEELKKPKITEITAVTKKDGKITSVQRFQREPQIVVTPTEEVTKAVRQPQERYKAAAMGTAPPEIAYGMTGALYKELPYTKGMHRERGLVVGERPSVPRTLPLLQKYDIKMPSFFVERTPVLRELKQPVKRHVIRPTMEAVKTIGMPLEFVEKVTTKKVIPAMRKAYESDIFAERYRRVPGGIIKYKSSDVDKAFIGGAMGITKEVPGQARKYFAIGLGTSLAFSGLGWAATKWRTTLPFREKIMTKATAGAASMIPTKIRKTATLAAVSFPKTIGITTKIAKRGIWMATKPIPHIPTVLYGAGKVAEYKLAPTGLGKQLVIGKAIGEAAVISGGVGESYLTKAKRPTRFEETFTGYDDIVVTGKKGVLRGEPLIGTGIKRGKTVSEHWRYNGYDVFIKSKRVPKTEIAYGKVTIPKTIYKRSSPEQYAWSLHKKGKLYFEPHAEFTGESKGTVGLFVSDYGAYYPEYKGIPAIGISYKLKGFEKQTTIAHELIHYKTEGKIPSIESKLPYSIQPSEILAYGMEKRMAKVGFKDVREVIPTYKDVPIGKKETYKTLTQVRVKYGGKLKREKDIISEGLITTKRVGKGMVDYKTLYEKRPTLSEDWFVKQEGLFIPDMLKPTERPTADLMHLEKTSAKYIGGRFTERAGVKAAEKVKIRAVTTGKMRTRAVGTELRLLEYDISPKEVTTTFAQKQVPVTFSFGGERTKYPPLILSKEKTVKGVRYEVMRPPDFRTVGVERKYFTGTYTYENPFAKRQDVEQFLKPTRQIPSEVMIPKKEIPTRKRLPFVGERVVSTVGRLTSPSMIPIIGAVGFAKSIPVSRLKPSTKAIPMVIGVPVTKATSITKALPVTKSLPITKAIPITRTMPISKMLPITRGIPLTKSILLQKQVAIQKQIAITKEVPPFVPVPVQVTPPPPPPTIIIPPFMPFVGKAKVSKTKKQKSVPSMFPKYKASYYAISEKVFAKKRPGVVTGYGIRPVIRR